MNLKIKTDTNNQTYNIMSFSPQMAKSYSSEYTHFWIIIHIAKNPTER